MANATLNERTLNPLIQPPTAAGAVKGARFISFKNEQMTSPPRPYSIGASGISPYPACRGTHYLHSACDNAMLVLQFLPRLNVVQHILLLLVPAQVSLRQNIRPWLQLP